MSDDKGSNWVGPFVLGFLLGVLICVGGGGTILLQRHRLLVAETEAARAEADMARDVAEREALRARQAQEETEQALRKARQALEEAERAKKSP
jgi:hypothetical protein